MFDVGRIEAIRFHKRKSESICTARIQFPFYCETEMSIGTVSSHEIKSSAFNNDPNFTPNKNGLWRLLGPRLDHSPVSKQKRIEHEGFQLLETDLQICENDSLNVKNLSKVLTAHRLLD